MGWNKICMLKPEDVNLNQDVYGASPFGLLFREDVSVSILGPMGVPGSRIPTARLRIETCWGRKLNQAIPIDIQVCLVRLDPNNIPNKDLASHQYRYSPGCWLQTFVVHKLGFYQFCINRVMVPSSVRLFHTSCPCMFGYFWGAPCHSIYQDRLETTFH